METVFDVNNDFVLPVVNNSPLIELLEYAGEVVDAGDQVEEDPPEIVLFALIDPTIGFHVELEDVNVEDPYSKTKFVFWNHTAYKVIALEVVMLA